jgi:hypothetical protein
MDVMRARRDRGRSGKKEGGEEKIGEGKRESNPEEWLHVWSASGPTRTQEKEGGREGERCVR